MDPNFIDKKLLPAVTLIDTDSALSVTEALLEGGLNVMEVTFRTSAAASAISTIVKEFPEMNIGAGTILSIEQVIVAKDAGAQFALAPGFNKKVIRAAAKHHFPFIPGITTPSEVEHALDHGFRLLKLFPVNNLGGPEYVKSLQGPYQHIDIKFIPMGGISISNMKTYLSYPAVAALGGSWLAPGDLIEQKQFGKISEIVRRSLDIVRQTA